MVNSVREYSHGTVLFLSSWDFAGSFKVSQIFQRTASLHAEKQVNKQEETITVHSRAEILWETN